MKTSFAFVLFAALFSVSSAFAPAPLFFKKKAAPAPVEKAAPAPKKAMFEFGKKKAAPAPAPAPAKKGRAGKAAPVKKAAPARKGKVSMDLPTPPTRGPKGKPPSLLASVRTAAPGVSRQRPFKFGGSGTSKFIGGAALERDDGLSAVERDLINRGESKALAGAAKLRYFFQK